MSKVVVISIKPEFVNKIFDGTKKIELRKASPDSKPGDLMIVYSTSPEMAVIGICRIKKILKSTPQKIWDDYSEVLGIDERRFFEYYGDSKKAVGIVIESTRRFRSKIPLINIKKKFPRFAPPQTFKYFSRDLISHSLTHSGLNSLILVI